MAKASRYMRLQRTNNLWTINGQTWEDVEDGDFDPIFANPQPGDVEIWEVENKSGGWFHPLHIHFVDFQVLSRNGRPPPARGEAARRTSSTSVRTRRSSCSCSSPGRDGSTAAT